MEEQREKRVLIRSVGDTQRVYCRRLPTPPQCIRGALCASATNRAMMTVRLLPPARPFPSVLTLLFALLLLSASTEFLLAQAPVTVTFFRPPPNQLKTTDLYRVRLNNATGSPIPIYLFGTVDEAEAGHIVEATSKQFDLPPGVTIINGPELQPIDAQYFSERHKAVFLRTGQAPTGEYTVCVHVHRADDRREIASDCFTQRVQVTTPPVLIFPSDGDTITTPVPTFTWAAPTPLVRGQQLRYKIRIVEVFARQTTYDAMQSNPAWFEREGINVRNFPLPISARKPRIGQEYAWQISAFDNDFPLGRSEIWGFTYGSGKIATRGTVDGNPVGRRTTITPKSRFAPKPYSIIDVRLGIDPNILKVVEGFIPQALLNELTTSCFGD